MATFDVLLASSIPTLSPQSLDILLARSPQSAKDVAEAARELSPEAVASLSKHSRGEVRAAMVARTEVSEDQVRTRLLTDRSALVLQAAFTRLRNSLTVADIQALIEKDTNSTWEALFLSSNTVANVADRGQQLTIFRALLDYCLGHESFRRSKESHIVRYVAHATREGLLGQLTADDIFQSDPSFYKALLLERDRHSYAWRPSRLYAHALVINSVNSGASLSDEVWHSIIRNEPAAGWVLLGSNLTNGGVVSEEFYAAYPDKADKLRSLSGHAQEVAVNPRVRMTQEPSKEALVALSEQGVDMRECLSLIPNSRSPLLVDLVNLYPDHAQEIMEELLSPQRMSQVSSYQFFSILDSILRHVPQSASQALDLYERNAGTSYDPTRLGEWVLERFSDPGLLPVRAVREGRSYVISQAMPYLMEGASAREVEIISGLFPAWTGSVSELRATAETMLGE